ncbi:MAG: class I SAM-dependent methyltransferase, partial [Acidobacteriota bacterium]
MTDPSTAPIERLGTLDAAVAVELGFDGGAWARLEAAVEAPLLRLDLEGTIPGDVDVQVGTRRPGGDGEDRYLLSVAALSVPPGSGVEALDRIRPRLGDGIQALRTTSGAKDFVYLFGLGFTPAVDVAGEHELLVFFPGASPDPLFFARQTNGGNYDLGPGDIVERLRSLDRRFGLRVLGAGWDWVEIEVLDPQVARPELAAELVDFCFPLVEDLAPDVDAEAASEDDGGESDTMSAHTLDFVIGSLDAALEGSTESTEPLTPAEFGGDAELLEAMVSTLRRANDDPQAREEVFRLVEANPGVPSPQLEDAQRLKMAHIAAKLNLKPGMRVLDIGCGWGGLSIYIAQNFDC